MKCGHYDKHRVDHVHTLVVMAAFLMQMMLFGVSTLASIALLLNGMNIGLDQTIALPKVSAGDMIVVDRVG